MDRVPLYEEFRLIERKENEINGAWKGVHLLLFFLAFVFGSFCTFCFHMLMYLFDEKCVLFPKLLSLTSSRHNVIYELIPEEKEEETPSLPVDFLSTQWVEKSTCYLPTFVPLVSGIFGLVWTTMFLMCSTGSRTLTGLQRPWRVLPPVFVFSLAMGGLCVYSSSVTHYGLKQLCVKLGEITGTSTCSYTINMATLAYERRIRGVYQATWLTIISAWLHTFCWLLSALVALLRILLAVDFQLVRISVDLIGDVDKLLESREEQIRTVSPVPGMSRENSFSLDDDTTIFHYRSKSVERLDSPGIGTPNQMDSLSYADEQRVDQPLMSELSLVPEERDKLVRLEAYQSVSKDENFIVKMLSDLFDRSEIYHASVGNMRAKSMENLLALQSEPVAMLSPAPSWDTDPEIATRRIQFEAVRHKLEQGALKSFNETERPSTSRKQPLTPYSSSENLVKKQEPVEDDTVSVILDSNVTLTGRENINYESSLNLTAELRKVLDKNFHEALEDIKKTKIKSSLKSNAGETDIKQKSKKKRKVQIHDSNRTVHKSPTSTDSDSEQGTDTTSNSETQEKNTQTKEKQD